MSFDPPGSSTGMRPRMPSVEDLDDEIKTFSGQLEGVKQGMSLAEKRFIDFLNNYEARVQRIESIAQRAETLSAQTSIAAQEAVTRVNQQLSSNTSLIMDMSRSVREIEDKQTKSLEKQAKIWRDVAPIIAPIIFVVLQEVLHSLGIGGAK